MMDLSTLKQAIEPLSQFGNEELRFEVSTDEGSFPVVLRPLLPREEVECQERANQILAAARESGEVNANDPLTRTTALTYFDSFRVEVISYALVQIGDTDLRSVPFVETGEVLDNGTKVKIPRHQALKKLIHESWSRGMITICFSKYGDLVARISSKADKVVSESVADLDVEIERLEKRLEEAKADRLKRATGDPAATQEQIRNLVDFGNAFEAEIEKTVEETRIQSELEEDLRNILAETEASIDSEPEPEPETSARQPVIPKTAPPPTPKPHEPTLEEKIKMAQQESLYSGLADLSQATPSGTVTTSSGEVVQAYRMPSQTLSDRGRQKKEEPLPTDSDPLRGTRNPHFKPR